MCWLCVCPAERAELEALRAQQLVCGSEDVGFLRYLAASYVSRGMHQQALQCLQRLTMLSPGAWRVCVLDSLLAVAASILCTHKALLPERRLCFWQQRHCLEKPRVGVGCGVFLLCRR